MYAYMQNKSIPSLIAGATLGSLYGLSSYGFHSRSILTLSRYWIRSGRALDGVDLSIGTHRSLDIILHM